MESEHTPMVCTWGLARIARRTPPRLEVRAPVIIREHPVGAVAAYAASYDA